MEDDEEYSYTGYAEPQEDLAEFKDSDEVFTYRGYADGAVEAAEEAVEERPASYGDYLIEEFSAETNVSRVTKFTRLPENIVKYFFAAIYFIVGVLCVAITDPVTELLPYIVGGMMIVIGSVRFVVALIKREYRHVKTNHTATSLIITALGIMIIVQSFQPENESAITFISIAWGILGLFEGAHAFNHAFKRIANSERCVFYLIKGLVELIVAFMLLYDPVNHETHRFHIIVFGLNLLFDSITMIPQVKAILSTK